MFVGVAFTGVGASDTVLGSDHHGVEADNGSSAEAEIDMVLQGADGEVEVILRLSDVDESLLPGDRETSATTLQTHAAVTQEPVLDRLERMDGVTIENRWWITNAIMVTVDTDRADLERLAGIDGIQELHRNHQFAAPEPVNVDADAEPTGDAYTYGLEQINVPATWDEFETTGQYIRVTVADTGVDADHPDIELAEEDGWIDFIGDSSDPVDNDGHGTHVSGTIAGGDSSGTAIGVAPDVELANARVCEGSTCDGAAIMNSIQWAVDTESDILSMSLGGPISGDYVDPVRNAMDAGTLVVASIGNDGEGTAGSPGAVYDSLASGATTEDEEVADFSGGLLIDSEDAFGDDAPDDWPDEYITPDIAAPGDDVLSAIPGGGYHTMSGTSMSAPHKSGAAALLLAASGGGLGPYDLVDVLEQTAWKPDDWDESNADDAIGGKDNRYGSGIIDVYAATASVAVDSGIEGVVTDDAGDPIEGAIVSVGGQSIETNVTGAYDAVLAPGTYDVTIDKFGYATETVTVTIDNETHVAERNFELADSMAVELDSGQPKGIMAGDTFTVSFTVANLESYAVDRKPGYDGVLSFTFDGEPIDEGEAVDVDDVSGEVALEVTTEVDTTGDLELEHTFTGSSDSEILTTRPTAVLEQQVSVAVVDDETLGHDVATRLNGQSDESVSVSVIDGAEAVTAASDGEYDVFVVQNIDEGHVQDFASYTNGDSTGVVWLDQWGNDQWGDESNGISVKSSVLDNPTSTSMSLNDQDPKLEILADHPIFEGVGEQGNLVSIHDANDPDRTWFAGYDGDVIGYIQAGGVTDGDGIGVDEGNRTVLLSSFGSTEYVTSGDYTSEADQILANAVEFVADDGVEPATFSGSVTIGDNPAPEGAVVEAYVDGELRGTTTVETPGEYGTADDPLVVDGAADDEGATVTFEVDGLSIEETAEWSAGGEYSLDLNASGTATIEVALGDDRFEQPIDDATVTATGTYGEFEAIELTAGEYRIEDLPADTYDVTAEAQGYDAETNDSVAVEADGTTEVDFWLVGNGAINGTIANAVTQQKLADATVTVTYPDGSTTDPVETDDAGDFAVDGLPGTGETYTIDVHADGFETATIEREIDAGDTDVGQIELNGSASIAGTVEDADGGPIEGVSIAVTSETGGEYHAQTGADGTYVVERVPGDASEYTVAMSKPGYTTNATTLESVTGDETDVDATLTRHAYYFAVDDLSAPDEVTEGDTVEIEATVANLGTDDGNDTVTLFVQDEEWANQSVSLNGTDDPADAATTTVSFTHEPSDAGSMTYNVTTSSESTEAEVTVEEASSGGISLPPPPAPEPSISVLSMELVTTEITVGETADVLVELRNSGDADGEQTLELAVDGAVVETATFDVPAGERIETTLSHAFDEPGTYELAVDGEIIGFVTVEHPADSDESSDDTEQTDDGDDESEPADDVGDDHVGDDGDGIPGFTPVVALIALSAVTLVARRRL
ncbi:S8 family serine peptidase [Halovivax gelatinilyticus]|uniref:S8 family serine peptidase n=1 Tax=Halovivax gelatinilyticus TaxID=2961597 RepID=UPI0020CA66D4|nr:S8 family serine peptidase [Halovivax gelatinilyticus]